MILDYDKITAYHYAAYRPALHEGILAEFLEPISLFEMGLDIGSGTGHSSIALAKYCSKVYGIEPSAFMMKKSLDHDQVTYQLYNKSTIDFEDDYFDVTTFAGSLYYAKSQLLVNELIRVSKNQSIVLVYDFEILLDELIAKLIN